MLPLGTGARRRPRRVAALTAGLAVGWLTAVSGAIAGPSVNQFETKDLEAETGNVQFQSQNAYMIGNPRRASKVGPDGDVLFDNDTVTRERLAQELEITWSRFLRTRVGLEFEKERLDDPASFAEADAYAPLKATEVAFEGVAILVPVDEKRGGFGLGLIAEYQHALVAGDSHTLYMGTILEAVSGPWQATANLFAVRHFAPLEMTDDGPIRDNKWDFAYAAQLKYHWSSEYDFAVEAYGTVDRIGNTGMPGPEALALGDHDKHRIGPVVYRTFQLGGTKLKHRLGIGKAASGVAGVGDDDDKPAASRLGKAAKDDDDDQPTARLGLGLLAGVTPSTPKLTLKGSLEIDF